MSRAQLRTMMRPFVLASVLFLSGCSGATSTPLVEKEDVALEVPDSGILTADGGPGSALGDTCASISELADPGLTLSRQNFPLCLESAGQPCSIDGTCEACGEIGQICCAVAPTTLPEGYFPQPNFCATDLLCDEPTHKCG